MSDPDENAFAGLPFFGDMMKAISSQGPLQWDLARQVAMTTALHGNTAEPNVDPADRIILESLAPIAELHVETHTGLSTTPTDRPRTMLVVNRTTWCHHTLEAYKPLFTTLASSLSGPDVVSNESLELATDDSMASMMAGLAKMMAPAMMGMSVGSMVGTMSQHAFGQYDIPLPRDPIHQLLLVPSNINSFASDWSLPIDDLRMWVLIQELTAHAVLGVPFVREIISSTVRRYVAGFRPNPAAMFERMTTIELTGSDPMAMLQKFLSDPSLILGAVRSKEQEALSPVLDAMVAAIIGYIDHSVDAVTSKVLGGGSQIAEAVRRRRVESSPNDVFLEQLLGLRLTRQQLERGRIFVDGVIERAGNAGISQLFSAPGNLPTPSELDAPGLWLARLEIQ
jgi:putative hydrolase